jgi:hypothetical protein
VEALKWELARISLAHRTGGEVGLDADTGIASGEESIVVPALIRMDEAEEEARLAGDAPHRAPMQPPAPGLYAAAPAAAAAAGGGAGEMLEESIDA